MCGRTFTATARNIGVTTGCVVGVTELVRIRQCLGADELAGPSSTALIRGTTAALFRVRADL